MGSCVLSLAFRAVGAAKDLTEARSLSNDLVLVRRSLQLRDESRPRSKLTFESSCTRVGRAGTLALAALLAPLPMRPNDDVQAPTSGWGSVRPPPQARHGSSVSSLSLIHI
eukprot:2817754-Prymnesium_polylepis.1